MDCGIAMGFVSLHGSGNCRQFSVPTNSTLLINDKLGDARKTTVWRTFAIGSVLRSTLAIEKTHAGTRWRSLWAIDES